MVLRRSLWELEKRYCILLFDMNTAQLITTHPLLYDDNSVVLVQVRSYEVTCCLVKEGESTLRVPSSGNHAYICRAQERISPQNVALVSNSPCLYVIYLNGLLLLSQAAKLYCKIILKKIPFYIYMHVST